MDRVQNLLVREDLMLVIFIVQIMDNIKEMLKFKEGRLDYLI